MAKKSVFLLLCVIFSSALFLSACRRGKLQSGSFGSETRQGTTPAAAPTGQGSGPIEVPVTPPMTTSPDFILWDQGRLPRIIVAYDSPDFNPQLSLRESFCESARNSSDPLPKKKCVESSVLDEAVTTLKEGLREISCVRTAEGSCTPAISAERQETREGAVCGAFTDEPCWKVEAPGRISGSWEIHVGLTDEARQRFGNTSDFLSLGDDGYLIRFLTEPGRPQRLYILGRTAYGTMFGVAGFLRDWVGARWILPGEPVVFTSTERLHHRETTWSVVATDQKSVPDFTARVLSGIGDHPVYGRESIQIYRQWLLRNRIRPEFHLSSIALMDNKPSFFLSEQNIDTSHRMNEYVDPALYGQPGTPNYHPEWYPTLKWYPYMGNARVSIRNFGTVNGRRIPTDVPRSLAVGRDPYGRSVNRWDLEDGGFADVLPSNALQMFWNDGQLVPHHVFQDAEGWNHFISGKLPDDFVIPHTLTLHERVHLMRVMFWDRLIPGGIEGWKPCFFEGSSSSARPRDSLTSHIATQITERFRKNPHQSMVSLAPNDGGGFCQCDRCRLKDGPFYANNQFDFALDFYNRSASQYTRRIVEFTNAVASRIPDKDITTYAYANYTALPPDEDLNSSGAPHQGPLRLAPNVHLIMVYPMDDAEFDRSPEEANAGPLRRNVERWVSRAGAHDFGVYDYVYGLGYMTPHVYLNRIVNGIRHAYHQGARMYVAEVYPHLSTDLYQLYVTMQLLWDTNQDVERLKEDFFKVAYSAPAALSMKEAYTVLERSWARHGNRWSVHRTGGLSHFADVEAAGGLAPGGLPFAWGKMDQFCQYTKADAERAAALLANAAQLSCTHPTESVCRRMEFTRPGLEMFLELILLARAKSVDDLGSGLKETRVDLDSFLNQKIDQSQAVFPALKSMHPNWKYFFEGGGPGVLSQLANQLNTIRNGPVERSLCEGL